jgi:hypothetical protein
MVHTSPVNLFSCLEAIAMLGPPVNSIQCKAMWVNA